MSLEIRRFSDLWDIHELVAAANGEGFNFLDRLVSEWNDGTNRFERPEEALLVVETLGRVVGVGGMTRQRDGVGRVRRFYVHPDFRNRGVGTALLDAILDHARLHYDEVVLWTSQPPAMRLYERLGFAPESDQGPDHATHRLDL
jgi:hypothetical protein